MNGGYNAALADPPPGNPFRELAYLTDENPDPRIVEVNLEAKLATVPVNGIPATLMTYNGYYPGPLIEANSGDIVRVHLKNSFPADRGLNFLGHDRSDTNIHTHGWHVSPEAPSDDVHIELNAGESYDYEYDLAKQPGSTISLFHPHLHGHVAESIWGGLIGTLITRDETDLLANYTTHTLMLKDISLYGGEPERYTSIMDYMMGKEGNILTVNGDVNPVLSIRPGEVQRWRVVNGANARFFRIGLEGHPLHIIGSDGGLLDKPYTVPYILLAPAERVDILVKASETSGTYRLQALPYSSGMGMMQGNSVPWTLMTVRNSGSAMDGVIPAQINPKAEHLEVDTPNLTHRTFVLQMGMGMGFINGQNYDVDPYTITSSLDTTEVWDIYNPSMMDHPFHMHMNHGHVRAIVGGDPVYGTLYTSAPGWKDDVIIPRGGMVRLIVPIRDYPGMVMFHCHIVEHEDIGMMGVWNIEPADGAAAAPMTGMKM